MGLFEPDAEVMAALADTLEEGEAMYALARANLERSARSGMHE